MKRGCVPLYSRSKCTLLLGVSRFVGLPLCRCVGLSVCRFVSFICKLDMRQYALPAMKCVSATSVNNYVK